MVDIVGVDEVWAQIELQFFFKMAAKSDFGENGQLFFFEKSLRRPYGIRNLETLHEYAQAVQLS